MEGRREPAMTSGICDVTVVVTVSERTAFLRQALESVRSQACTPREVILTDDSDSRAIQSIAEEMRWPTLRYRSNAHSLGAAGNVRRALEEAKGKYVAILNDDDVWEPRFLARLTTPLEQNAARVVAFSDHWLAGPDGFADEAMTNRHSARYGRAALVEGDLDDAVDFVLAKNGVSMAVAAVFRRDALPPPAIAAEVAWAYDLWIACFLAASGRPFYYVPERLARWRVHPGMETARVAADKSASLVFLFARLRELRLLSPSKEPLLRNCLRQAWRASGREQLLCGRARDARRSFRMALELGFEWRSFAGLLLSALPHGGRFLRVVAEPLRGPS